MVNQTRPTPVERAALGLSRDTSEEDREYAQRLAKAEMESDRLRREAGIDVDPWLLEGGK